MFFVSYDIIEHQHIGTVIASLLRDRERRLTNLEFNFETKLKSLQFETLVLCAIRDFFLKKFALPGDYEPFVETVRVEITLRFC